MNTFNLAIELEATAADAAGEFGDQLLNDFGDYHPAVTVTTLGRAELLLSCPAENMAQALATARLFSNQLNATRIVVEPTADFDRRTHTEIPPLVSVTEAAEMLGLTRAAIQRRIDKGTLPACQVGSGWVIPKAALA